MSDGSARFDLSAPLEALHSNERVKHESHQLRGTLAESLADAATGACRPDSAARAGACRPDSAARTGIM